MDGGQAIAFGQQGQTFNDQFLGVVLAIEDGSDRFDKDAGTGTTLVALGTCLNSTKPMDVAAINLPLIRTFRIPTERAGMHEQCLFYHLPCACRCAARDIST